LAELEGSEMSVGDFATERRLHPQRLYRWRRRMATKAKAVTRAPAFAEITVREHDREQGVLERFEIELGRGRVVRVGPSFDAEALRRLVRLLQEDGPC
jgi:transposase-like protein